MLECFNSNENTANPEELSVIELKIIVII